MDYTNRNIVTGVSEDDANEILNILSETPDNGYKLSIEDVLVALVGAAVDENSGINFQETYRTCGSITVIDKRNSGATICFLRSDLKAIIPNYMEHPSTDDFPAFKTVIGHIEYEKVWAGLDILIFRPAGNVRIHIRFDELEFDVLPSSSGRVVDLSRGIIVDILDDDIERKEFLLVMRAKIRRLLRNHFDAVGESWIRRNLALATIGSLILAAITVIVNSPFL